MKLRKAAEPILQVLRENGVTKWHIEQTGGDHVRITWKWRGETLNHICPLTTSCARGPKNGQARVRRLMGVKKPIRKNPANRDRQTNKVENPEFQTDPPIEVKDPWARLREVRI